MSNLVDEPLVKLIQLIRTGSVSPFEIAEAHLNRIAELNPKLNAIITLAPDVLDRARRAEEMVMRGAVLGPLHGVPVTIKDTIETAGLRTTSGSQIRADYLPQRDAPAVARLKAAGAIILGKTNTAEMATDYTADNPVFGRTNHPLNHALTPGGSSGGEAVAIATHMSAGGIGSDLAGSVRIPAHFCGIAGLKPTVGRIPGEGQFPTSTGPYSLGAAIGPMARCISDLELMFSVLSGINAGISSFAGGRASLADSRVAYYTDDGVAPVTEETLKTVEAAARSLSDAGLVVEQT